MFEVWINKREPHVRIVVSKGSGLPAELGARDWALSGAFDAEPEIAREVLERGYAFEHSGDPPPDPKKLKNDGAANS